MKNKTLIVLTGPTASGKSALAIKLAHVLNTEIISADSRQIYKGIPIVTAVPSIEEREGVKHHLLEKLPLDAYYSASLFRNESMQIIDQIFKKNDFVIACGGSMLYIDALVNGIDDLPTVPPEIRNHLMNEWSEKGNEWLLENLKLLDENYYMSVDLKNLKRVFHAIEISITAGVPYSSLLNKTKINQFLPYKVVKFCLNGNREKLFYKINHRVSKMVSNGLLQEAESVYPYRDLNSLNTVGLKELFAYFDGIFSLEQAFARIQKNTRVYAKKQLTWHKRDINLKYLDFSDPIDYNTDRILNILNSNL